MESCPSVFAIKDVPLPPPSQPASVVSRSGFGRSGIISTAQTRTSGENLFVTLLKLAPPIRELEPSANTARFRYS